MPEMKFILPGPETVTLSGHDVDKLLRTGDGNAALLYLYILKTHGHATSVDAASELGKNIKEIASAMSTLGRLGLIQYDGGDARQESDPAKQQDHEAAGRKSVQETVPDDEIPRDDENPLRPRYTISEIRRELEHGSVFSLIVEEAQRCLGSLLSPDDLLRLFGIYDNLRLPPDVIMYLINHCIIESRKKNGGRKPTVKYIEKAAYIWEREGIFTLDKAERYVKKLEHQGGIRGEIKNVLKIKDRELSATELRYIDDWIELGFTAEAVDIAFDRTLLKTGRLVWGYMDSIIKSWHSKGLFTPDDIRAKDGRRLPKTLPPPERKQKYGAPNQEDIERMKKLLQKIKED